MILIGLDESSVVNIQSLGPHKRNICSGATALIKNVARGSPCLAVFPL
jgi:hypothetical protein